MRHQLIAAALLAGALLLFFVLGNHVKHLDLLGPIWVVPYVLFFPAVLYPLLRHRADEATPMRRLVREGEAAVRYAGLLWAACATVYAWLRIQEVAPALAEAGSLAMVAAGTFLMAWVPGLGVVLVCAALIAPGATPVAQGEAVA